MNFALNPKPKGPETLTLLSPVPVHDARLSRHHSCCKGTLWLLESVNAKMHNDNGVREA